MNNGKLVVMEAGDGSGKATQSEILLRHLLREGFTARKISFPDYDSPSSSLVKMYLNGEFGKEAADVNAYAASLFYAADRFASFRTKWRDFRQNDEIIIADRYVTSNMAHQAAKISDEVERANFLAWLDELEYEKLALPRPDLVIFLDMPPRVARKLIESRARAEDIHEKDAAYLEKSYVAYCRLAEQYGWTKISCADESDNPLPTEEIGEKVWAAARKVL